MQDDVYKKHVSDLVDSVLGGMPQRDATVIDEKIYHFDQMNGIEQLQNEFVTVLEHMGFICFLSAGNDPRLEMGYGIPIPNDGNMSLSHLLKTFLTLSFHDLRKGKKKLLIEFKTSLCKFCGHGATPHQLRTTNVMTANGDVIAQSSCSLKKQWQIASSLLYIYLDITPNNI